MALEVIADEPRSTNPVTSSGQHEPSTAVMSCCKVRQCSCTIMHSSGEALLCLCVLLEGK